MNATNRITVPDKTEARIKALKDLGFVFDEPTRVYFYLNHKITQEVINSAPDDQFFEMYCKFRDEITGKNRLPKT